VRGARERLRHAKSVTPPSARPAQVQETKMAADKAEDEMVFRETSAVRHRSRRGPAAPGCAAALPATRARPLRDPVPSVRGEGRDVSLQYGARDETCPVSTGRVTRRFQLVRGEGRDVSS